MCQYKSTVSPARGTALGGCSALDGWVSGPEDVGEGGLSTAVSKHSYPWGLLFKTSSLVGDEVPHPRPPELGPLVDPVSGSSWLLGPYIL